MISILMAAMNATVAILMACMAANAFQDNDFRRGILFTVLSLVNMIGLMMWVL